MKKLILIGLCGPARVGKSTTALHLSLLARNGNYHSVPMAFADPLYETIAAMTGKSVAWLKMNKETVWTAENAPAKCLIGSTVRRLFQIVGTECVRDQLHPDFWVDRLAARAELTASADAPQTVYGTFVFIEDVRFPNEASICHSLVELHRVGIEYARDHVSAHRLSDVDFPRPSFEVSNSMNYAALLRLVSAHASKAMAQA